MTGRFQLPWHYTATGYVFDSARTRMLLVHHKKLHKWIPPGGHVDDGELPHVAALREVAEEVGLDARIVHNGKDLGLTGSQEVALPMPLAILDEIIPEGRDPQHRHIDHIYVMEVDGILALRHAEAEVNEAAWFSKDELRTIDTFDAVRTIGLWILGD